MGYREADIPEDRDLSIATAIYELGMTLSSPKLILELMPSVREPNSEHLKSHLQKCRIHRERSLTEFASFYYDNIKDKIESCERRKSEPNNEGDGDNSYHGGGDAKNTVSGKRKNEEKTMKYTIGKYTKL